MYRIEQRPLLVSRGWIQAAAIVMIIGFSIMGVLTYYTYNDEPPIPNIVKVADGTVLFTHSDVSAGQQIFLRNGLMQYGFRFRSRRLSRSGLHYRVSASRSIVSH